MKKQYAVFGLGTFGQSVALSLEHLGCEVLAVDKSLEKVQEISDHVSYAVRADIEDGDIMQAVGARNLDGAVIAITENFETSILATIKAKEIGIPYVIAKAQSELQGKVLAKVGADKIIYPEKEMGMKIARGMVATNFAEWIDISPDFSIAECHMPKAWGGRTLVELNLRESMELNVVGVMQDGNVDISFDPNKPLPQDAVVIVIGPNAALDKLKKG